MIQRVSKVSLAKKQLPATSSLLAFFELGVSGVEACSAGENLVQASYHPFVAAVHISFAEHRPLVLSPDMFWLLVTQAFARHMRTNAEALRNRFVDHAGQKMLTVRRDEFVKGAEDNDWPSTFDEFSRQINEHIGDTNHARLVAEFSTTGAIEKAANEIVMMGALQSYFTYSVMTLCGIPEVQLEGTPEDWASLVEQVSGFGDAYSLKWIHPILPVLERISKNAGGHDDAALWKDFYKLDEQSGGPFITGWILHFFPSVRASGLGITAADLPGSLSQAPFEWLYYGVPLRMQFLAGFHAYSQDPMSLAVRPEIGWCVADHPPS